MQKVADMPVFKTDILSEDSFSMYVLDREAGQYRYYMTINNLSWNDI